MSVEDTFTYDSGELDALEGAHNYYRAILARFAPFLSGRVLEVGAGVGTFAARVLALPGVEQLVLVEPASNLAPRLHARFGGDGRVEVARHVSEVDRRTAFDCAVMVNVLEHVLEEHAMLVALRNLLRPGGSLLLLAPAYPFLFGSLDEAFGHVRRYTKSGLAESLRAAGFEVSSLRYFNGPGVVSWFVAGRVLRRRTISPGDVKLYDRWVMPWVSAVERKVEPPFGQSLVAVARRAGADASPAE